MAVPQISRQKGTFMVMYTVPGMKSDDAERVIKPRATRQSDTLESLRVSIAEQVLGGR